MGRISAERLRSLLRYDPETGVFVWAVRRSNFVYAGMRAGRFHRSRRTKTTYRMIRIDDALYYEHRLAWLYVTGEWPKPKEQIDHIDLDGTNNRWANLRLTTKNQNLRNCLAKKNNRSGFKGVFQDKSTGRWRAAIRVNYRLRHLGIFATPEEAHAAYLAEATRLYGEFARG